MKKTGKTMWRRDFTLVVIGQIVSLFGNAVLRFALPLWLLRETGSSALFGVVTAVSFAPMIALSLVGGALADRVNKRNIMVGLDFLTAGLTAAFYVLQERLPAVPLIIAALMLLYAVSGAYQPAVQASIPVLVEPGRITQANAVINMVNTLAGLFGPVLGGVLFGAWGIAPVLAVSAVCFACSAVMELFIRIPFQRQPAGAGVLAVLRGDLGESRRYIALEKPVFLQAAVVLALFNLVLSAAMIVGVPIVMVNVLGMGDEALGAAQGALGLGGLAGGILAGALDGRLRLRRGYLLLAVCAAAAALMGAALLPGVPRLAAYLATAAMSFAVMAASTLFVVQICAAVQRQTPPQLVGKIMAFILAVSNSASPVGQALYGLLFDLAARSAWAVLFGAAAASLAVALCSRPIFVGLERG
ncbi:MFS transporter [Anaerotruncus colihominis]|uniref:MFS transporter n=1 Tax=Anaerotruncus colihominis TaxID=169435 RepID=UPI001896B09E|nr:MFS transporter [Anaerotruncus colihominis]